MEYWSVGVVGRMRRLTPSLHHSITPDGGSSGFVDSANRAHRSQLPSTHRVNATGFSPFSAIAWLTVFLSSLAKPWYINTPCSP